MWKTLSFEARGNSYVDRSIPCKDQTIQTKNFGVSVISLAEGCEESSISHFGAKIAAEKAAEYVTVNFDDLYNCDENEAKNNILQYVLRAITKQSAVMGTKAGDLASTLLIVAVKEDKYFSYYLGDGVIGYFVENEMEVLLANFAEFNQLYTTSNSASSEVVIRRGQINNIKGFILMSSNTDALFKYREQGNFSNIISEIVYYNAKNKDYDIESVIEKSFNEFIVNETQSNSAITMLVANTTAVRYYSLSDFEKILFFKFPTLDENSINRVRDLDNILSIITTDKSIEELSRILEVEEKFLKRKLDILVNTNLLTVTKDNVYKKVN